MFLQNKEILISIILGIILMLFLVSVLVISLIRYNKKLYAHLKEKQSMQLKFNEILLQSQIEIQEQTFKLISQEIHDNIGQELSFVKLSLNSILGKLNAETKEIVSESKELVAKSIQQLRDIAKSLNTDYLNDIGLPEAIRQQLKFMERTGSFKTELVVKGEFTKIESMNRLVLFRSIQELLNNIINHSSANKVIIEMIYSEDNLLISVSDNGKGFDVEKFTKSKHKGIGISNVVNRIKLINGIINIKSYPDEGTVTTIELNKKF